MIRVERLDGVAQVTIDRADARNAMTFAMWDRLRDVARELDADASVRVVLVTGSGDKAFVSGTDIAEFAGFTADDGVAYERRIDAAMAAVDAIRVPVIAAIAGACTGGGAALAACCDLRIGAANVRVGVPVARTLGNALSPGNLARVGRLIGLDAVKTLVLTGQLLGAADALRAGFLTHVVGEDEALHDKALALAYDLTALAPLTLQVTKETVRRMQPLASGDYDDLLRTVYGSRDFAEGVAAFTGRRQPRWEGR